MIPHNCPTHVAERTRRAWLRRRGSRLPTPSGEMPLRRALTEIYDLGKPSADLIALVGGA